jgi:hypothetical protein
MNRLLKIGAVLLTVCLTFGSCEQSDPVAVRGTLIATNDTIYCTVTGFANAFAVADVQPFDTINNELEIELMLYANDDTLVFSPDTTPQYVKLVSGSTSKILTITYFNQSRRDVQKHLDLLRRYASFSPDATTLDFQFSYAPATDNQLVEFKRAYNLDSVAGNGDEISRIMNLLNWANKIVRHDGSQDPADPRPRNAMNIIKTCRETNKGVNCRMLATLLNEAYLSTGFRSRHVTCLPHDKEDPDCHVINVVYSDSLDKWLYVDPTFAGYFMGADSTLLSIEEVRQKLITGEELLLPDALNWNGEPKEKRGYRSYMTKNLFRFSCPVSSEFGYESGDHCGWVYLNPVGYDDEMVNSVDTTTFGDGTTGVYYYTADAEEFWRLQ